MNKDASERPPEVIPEISLGWRLRIALAHAGIRADDMARMLDVHRGTITRWTHDVAKPRRVYVEKWAEYTGVAYEWLAGDGLRCERPPETGGAPEHPFRAVELPPAAIPFPRSGRSDLAVVI